MKVFFSNAFTVKLNLLHYLILFLANESSCLLLQEPCPDVQGKQNNIICYA